LRDYRLGLGVVGLGVRELGLSIWVRFGLVRVRG